MLTIAIRYLTGRAAATSVANRAEAEWPPHPGRLFMALVASWGESGRSDLGRAALQWLEAQPAPALSASDADLPEAVTFFVPVNDAKGEKLLPDTRHKAGRQFPTAIPDVDTVFVTWREAEPSAEHRAALAEMVGNVGRVGRSSSLVQVWLAEESESRTPTLVPTNGKAEHRLRIPTKGRFDQLEARFVAKAFPDAGAWHAYASPQPPSVEALSGSLAGDFLILKRSAGVRLGLESSLLLCAAFRGSVLAAAGDAAPEVITGHSARNEPTLRPHLAFVPLPDVGHEHADGHLLGLAVVLPPDLSEEDRSACIAAVAQASDRPLVMGDVGEWRLESEPPGESSRRALDQLAWTRPSTRWATVTPVVLDRFPKADGDAEATVALACERAGLPRPRDVIIVPVSPIVGVPAGRSFPAEAPRQGKPRRWHTHAILTFDQPVAGPVLVGAGRFRGYGLCRPLGGSDK